MLDAVTFNIYAGNDAPVRNTQIMLRAAGRPRLATIQEAGRLGDIEGYQRLHGDPADFPNIEKREALSTQLLVREDVKVRKHIARPVPKGDWSWNGNKRDPRVFHRAVLEDDGIVSEFWGIHRCPGGPDTGIDSNQRAWNAEDDFLAEWVGAKVEKFPQREFVIGGDWNTFVGKAPQHPHSIERLAKRLGGDLYMRHIDGFLVISPDRKGPGRPQRPNVRKLDRSFGSDAHRPVVLSTS